VQRYGNWKIWATLQSLTLWKYELESNQNTIKHVLFTLWRLYERFRKMVISFSETIRLYLKNKPKSSAGSSFKMSMNTLVLKKSDQRWQDHRKNFYERFWNASSTHKYRLLFCTNSAALRWMSRKPIYTIKKQLWMFPFWVRHGFLYLHVWAHDTKLGWENHGCRKGHRGVLGRSILKFIF